MTFYWTKMESFEMTLKRDVIRIFKGKWLCVKKVN